MSPATGRGRSGLARWPGPAPAQVLGWIAYAVLVYGPIVALALGLGSLGSPGAGSGSVASGLPVSSADLALRPTGLLLRSLGLAGLVAVMALGGGVLVATVLWPGRPGRTRLLPWLAVSLAAVPAYVHALAWSRLLFQLNQILGALDWPTLPTSGLAVAAWVQLMAVLPLALGIAWWALAGPAPELIQAARLARPEPAVLVRITLPLAAPLLGAGAVLIGLLSLLDYSVPSLFQVNTYSLALFAEYAATGSAARALALALPLLALTGLATALAVGLWRPAALRPARAAESTWAVAAEGPWPVSVRLAQGLALGLLALQGLVLGASLVAATGGPGRALATTLPVGDELAYSFALATLTGTLALPAALAVALTLAASQRGLAWFLAVFPLAIPAPLIGIGLILLWNRPGMPPLYSTAWMPVLAGLARFTPLAALLLAAQIRRADPALVDAARVFQAGPVAGWLRIRLPMLAPGLVAAAGLVFALTLGELGATLLVAAPGRGTLSIRIYNYLHYGSSDAVAALCLWIALGTALAGALAIAAWRLGRRWSVGGADA